MKIKENGDEYLFFVDVPVGDGMMTHVEVVNKDDFRRMMDENKDKTRRRLEKRYGHSEVERRIEERNISDYWIA